MVSVVNFRRIVRHYYLKYVFFLIISFISFGSSRYMYVIFLILSRGPWMLYSVSAFTPGLTFFLQNFNLASFYWPVFQLLFLFSAMSAVLSNPLTEVVSLLIVFFSSNTVFLQNPNPWRNCTFLKIFYLFTFYFLENINYNCFKVLVFRSTICSSLLMFVLLVLSRLFLSFCILCNDI